MKKISKLAGIVAAAALLCGISACDNSETITMTSAKIEMVGDPIVTDKAAIFQWKDSVANSVRVTRQAPDEEEVTLADGWILNGFADRVTNKNLLKAGVEYTYRFYNTSDVSSARTTEYTLEKKYSCVERKVTFESIAPAGTKLAPITKEQVEIKKSESNGNNYLSVYVDEKESNVWITIEDQDEWVREYDYTDYEYKWQRRKYEDLYKSEIGGLEGFKYNPYHTYKLLVGKWWPGDAKWNEEENDKKYYDSSDATIEFDDLAATKNNSISISTSGETLEATWSGKKDSKYEISFEAFDNKENAVALKPVTIKDADIKKDAFYTCLATGKLSDIVDTTKPITVKTVKLILKETAKDGTVYESEKKVELPAYLTSYTQLERKYDSDDIRELTVEPQKVTDGNTTYVSASVELYGANLPDTAKLYYKRNSEALYTEITGGLKKVGNKLTVLLAKDVIENYMSYDFKAVVTMDNAKWYDWEEGKTEEVATKYGYVNLDSYYYE